MQKDNYTESELIYLYFIVGKNILVKITSGKDTFITIGHQNTSSLRMNLFVYLS